MHIVYERCCGLDVHKKSIMACLLTPDERAGTRQQVRRFGTMTRDLLELSHWLTGNGVTHVAMESTGVYWKPVWNILEAVCTILLVNAQHVKAVPGRKTDAKDCQWIADLLQHGLLRGSFVPPSPIRELRDLTRTRASLRQDHTAVANRMQKILEDANVRHRWQRIGSAYPEEKSCTRCLMASKTVKSSPTFAVAVCAKKSLRWSLPWRDE